MCVFNYIYIIYYIYPSKVKSQLIRQLKRIYEKLSRRCPTMQFQIRQENFWCKSQKKIQQFLAENVFFQIYNIFFPHDLSFLGSFSLWDPTMSSSGLKKYIFQAFDWKIEYHCYSALNADQRWAKRTNTNTNNSRVQMFGQIQKQI